MSADNADVQCSACARAAACYGRETCDEDFEPFCDAHCGHGNEASECFPIADGLALLALKQPHGTRVVIGERGEVRRIDGRSDRIQ